jgi:hypothetical protein
VTRNLLAMAEGVTLTMCWNLAPEVPNYRDPFNLMGFLSDKLALMDFEGGALGKVEPAGEAFRRLAAAMQGATSVARLDGEPGIVAIAVERGARGPLHVIWTEGDAFAGEDEAPRVVRWPWPHTTAKIVDAFGAEQQAEVREGRFALKVGVTPLLLSD